MIDFHEADFKEDRSAEYIKYIYIVVQKLD